MFRLHSHHNSVRQTVHPAAGFGDEVEKPETPTAK